MLKQRFNWLVNLVMLPTAIWVAATGIIAELFDINDFVLHKYPAFGLAVLLAIHFLLRLPQWLSGTWRLLTGWRPRPAGSTAPPVKAAAIPADLTRRNVLLWLGSALGGFLVGNFLAPTRRTTLPTDEDIGVVYHHWSKPGNVSLISTVIDWGTQPPLFKEYADAPKITLPSVTPRDGMSVEQAIVRRRSVRDYVGELTLDELNRLLFYSTGINDLRWGSGLRAAPSSGAQYPIETYLVVNYVAGLAQGIYHYNVRDHALEQIRVGDFRQTITDAALGQEFFGKAGVVFALTGIFQRARWRYQDRTYRYVMLEAGHIGQNIYLEAVAQGLGACAVGAFWDDEVNRLLGVDGKTEATLYLLTVGAM
jgi:SagB-type dehydrogenase family enzyme